jgi:hypothetical protein
MGRATPRVPILDGELYRALQCLAWSESAKHGYLIPVQQIVEDILLGRRPPITEEQLHELTEEP